MSWKWSPAVLLLCGLVQAQVLLPREQAQRIERALEQFAASERLDCRIEPYKPFLDFAFRFESGFVVHCPVGAFDGKAARLSTYIRVRPSASESAVLAEVLTVPAIPPEMHSKAKLSHAHSELEYSGAFALGVGEYSVDVFLVDDRNRLAHKHWMCKAAPHGRENQAPMILKPNTVASVFLPVWRANRSDEKRGLRVTVLLDAAPIYPNSLNLRAWDRAFLLESLSSVLREIPTASVRLVAFNLDQQREIFRQDDVTRASFTQLAKALNDLELGTVSYQTLERRQGWSELLASLVNAEIAADDPPDAVIFLGPNNRINQKVPREMLKARNSNDPLFFYLEYYPRWGSDFPDAITHVTNACNGTVLKLHTPADLAEAIHKMERKVREQTDKAPAELKPQT